MPWIVLVFSGLMEAVWATALGRIDGLTKPLPIILFIAGSVLSVGGLAYALRSLSTGTAYAVWVGIGAASTVAYAMITGDESISLVKILLIVGLVGCVIGLKVVSDTH